MMQNSLNNGRAMDEWRCRCQPTTLAYGTLTIDAEQSASSRARSMKAGLTGSFRSKG